jgi:hypothetical protein
MTDKLNEMWTALTAYQTKADADGHGESWAQMCSEKTEIAAYDAGYAARVAAWNADDRRAWAAWDAACAAAEATYAARTADAGATAAHDEHVAHIVRVEHYAQRSIDSINKATGETK